MSSKTKFFRFILTPLDKIFFGGEKSPFLREEYYLHSRYFPQQTTLLGFLRYWLLKQSGAIDQPRATWQQLIGDRSFDATPNQTFGAIHRISPLRISQMASDGTIAKDLYWGRLANGLQPHAAPGAVRYTFGEQLAYDGFHLLQNQQNTYLEKGDGYFQEHLTDFNGTQQSIQIARKETRANHPIDNQSAVFISDVKPGITKNYGGEAKDDGYFKVEYYRMVPGFAYSFLAELDVSLLSDQWFHTSFLRFGGDSTMVRADILAAEHWDNFSGQGNIFVALCDAVVDNTIYDLCQNWVTDTLPFRNLKTATQDQSFSKRPSRKWYLSNQSQFDAHESRVLLKRGSILVARQGMEEILQTKLANPVFEKIGYNHFIRLSQLP